MEPTRAAGALAEASAALVAPHDIPGFLVDLLRSCEEVLDVDAGGVLLADNNHLELIAASNHDAHHLELYQTQLGEGPCVDAHHSSAAVVAGPDDLTDRWPTFGPVMLKAGFHVVHASPLSWRHEAIGAMGLFRRSGRPLQPDEVAIAQAFADIATLLITQAEDSGIEDQIARALETRVVIEQAKGIVAELHHLDMADAYQFMIDRAALDGHHLTAVANHILTDAQRR